jgi:hypothetical protein
MAGQWRSKSRALPVNRLTAEGSILIVRAQALV